MGSRALYCVNQVLNPQHHVLLLRLERGLALNIAPEVQGLGFRDQVSTRDIGSYMSGSCRIRPAF